MSEYLEVAWGNGEELTILQVSVRSIVMFFLALVLLRIGGLRIFGKKSAFDEIVAIMLGAPRRGEHACYRSPGDSICLYKK